MALWITHPEQWFEPAFFQVICVGRCVPIETNFECPVVILMYLEK